MFQQMTAGIVSQPRTVDVVDIRAFDMSTSRMAGHNPPRWATNSRSIYCVTPDARERVAKKRRQVGEELAEFTVRGIENLCATWRIRC